MAYSELIKSFEKIRGYMREFYVYGFKSRDEYNDKSARSYDNERRRIESWLGDYMDFHQDSNGKSVFLSVDNRGVPHNPLYKAFKAKSFTENDITLHFYILDILADGDTLTVKQIVDRLSECLASFETADTVDESTVRKKLKEYEQLGLLKSAKIGRELAFHRSEDNVNLESWREAIDFYSESDPVGVIGSYLQDKLGVSEEHFSFKHHYLLHAMDSEIVYHLLLAIRDHRRIDLTCYVVRRGELRQHVVLPMKIYVSTQSGRHYLVAYHHRLRRIMFFRIDNIRKVKAGDVEDDFEKYNGFYRKFTENLWGVSIGSEYSLDHVEMTVHVGRNEGYIVDRLNREKRCGKVEKIDDSTYRFTADVYDATEMLPWVRTFIGRIVSFDCSNEFTKERFYEDLNAMKELYGGETDAVQ